MAEDSQDPTRQIVADLPMGLGAELCLHQLVEFSTGQGIGHADPNIIRARGFQELADIQDRMRRPP